MNTRTDMAHEALQRCPELSGVEEENESKGRMRISRIRIQTRTAERKLDKPRGSYITLTLPEDGLSSKEVRQEAGRCLASELSLLMGEVKSVLVVGLGNRHVTPDALGPQTIESLFVTRHVQNHFPELLPDGTRTVAAFAAGVMGMTGVETAEGSCSPGRDSGLKAGDVITHITGREVDTVEEVQELLAQEGEQPLTIQAVRSDRQLQLSVRPVRSREGKQQLGVWLRDSMAGIGTMTFYDPASGQFGALGHGINDTDTATLMPMESAARGKVPQARTFKPHGVLKRM